MHNLIDNSANRNVTFCNFNQHINALHVDRVMDEHDLIYIQEGLWYIAQEGTEYTVGPGDVILLQAGRHHYGTRPCSGTVKTCFIHFSADENDTVAELNKEPARHWAFPMVVHCGHDPMVEQFFHRVIHSYWSDDLYADQKASAYLSLLLSEISEINALPDKHATLVDDIKNQIRTTPGRFIRAEEFAEKHHCSVRTISSKFKENTGYSLHLWQMQQKCRMADELMKYDSTLTLKELAATFGFYDEYHFSKSFKKIMGRSPKKRG